MSAFYGSIKGSRSIATRCGTRNSGIKTTAQSWDGSVIVNLNYNENKELMVSIKLDEGSSTGYGNKLAEFNGTFNEFVNLIKGVKNDR